MKAPDQDLFESAMEEEVQKMIEEEIFEEVPISSVPCTHNILGAMWSHRRKTTPSREIYWH